MKIAIVGTGISGLGAAYMLAPHHDLTIYEKNSYIGGHSRTIEVVTGNSTTAVDTGFIVFNDRNYPQLSGLFNHLGVAYEKSDMSFGVSIADGWLEYGSDHMFAQYRNILRPRYWRMLADVLRFNRQAIILVDKYPDITLGKFLDRINMGGWFKNHYLLAMGAAIWSCPVETIMQFPARTYLQFFKNHGLLTLNDHPQWYTVTGGSREYVSKLTAGFKEKIRLNCGVSKLFHNNGKFSILDDSGNEEIFDQVIFACHANQTLSIIDQPSTDEVEILGAFSYQENTIIVHSDTDFMPKNKKCWSSWVYLSGGDPEDNPTVSLSYWMNNLQNLDPDYPIIVTLNPGSRLTEDKIFEEHVFSHPVFDLDAIKAQGKVKKIQGKRGLWFCGAYQQYGFHEDGLCSAVNIAQEFKVTIPWD
jgi:predicted NAD/FAD-binding protein